MSIFKSKYKEAQGWQDNSNRMAGSLGINKYNIGGSKESYKNMLDTQKKSSRVIVGKKPNFTSSKDLQVALKSNAEYDKKQNTPTPVKVNPNSNANTNTVNKEVKKSTPAKKVETSKYAGEKQKEIKEQQNQKDDAPNQIPQEYIDAAEKSKENTTGATTDQSTESNMNNKNTNNPGFLGWNNLSTGQKWMAGTAAGAGIVGLGTLAYKLFKKDDEDDDE